MLHHGTNGQQSDTLNCENIIKEKGHFDQFANILNNRVLLLPDNTIRQLIDEAACNKDSESSVYLNELTVSSFTCVRPISGVPQQTA